MNPGVLFTYSLVLSSLLAPGNTSFSSPRTKKSTEVAEEEKKKEEVNLLYKVSLDSGTERSKIYNYSKKRVKFSTSEFSQPVRKYDVFLVLNDSLSGVLAEVVVVKVKRGKKIAYAKKSRVQESFKLRDLVGKTVIRLDELGDVMGSILVYRRNPVIAVGLAGRSMILSTANVATGIDLDPQVLQGGAEISLFVPGAGDAGWLNWFGYRFAYAKFTESSITIKTAKSGSNQNAIFSGERKNSSIIFQPWFEDLWIHQITVLYGLSHQKKDSITFSGSSDNGEDITFTVEQSAGFFGLGFGVNPVHNLYGGVLLKTMGSQGFTVSDSSSDELREGFWNMKSYGAWASWIHAISYEMKMSLKFEISLREDTISKAQEIGSGNDHKITDWEKSVSLGVQYAP